MDASFWHQRWKENEIGFHEQEANPLLTEHYETLELASGSRIFVPLCGKSHDLTWLASQGLEVVGAELSELAVESYFKELGEEPLISRSENISTYKAGNIQILVGDIFCVTKTMLDGIDAIYDRAALVALPETTRIRYTKHLIDVTDNAKQLLINYVYDQSLMDGPPFSISDDELNQHYSDNYDILLQASREVESKLKGHTATEKVWLLNQL